MSSTRATHGTNSPPLEATGSHIPLGASSVNAVAEGKSNVEAVPDADQRKRKRPSSRNRAFADGKVVIRIFRRCSE
jgi:hypothetical protein